jgi:ATP-dependent Clp protease ATP-binding subunit ClpC
MIRRGIIAVMNWFWQPRANDVIGLARQEAAVLGTEYVGTETLLIALAGITNRPVGRAMQRCGLNQERLRREMRRLVAPPPPGMLAGLPKWRIPLTPRVKQAIDRALVVAKARGAQWYEVEDVLIALLQDQTTVAFQMVTILASPADLQQAVIREAGRGDAEKK